MKRAPRPFDETICRRNVVRRTDCRRCWGLGQDKTSKMKERMRDEIRWFENSAYRGLSQDIRHRAECYDKGGGHTEKSCFMCLVTALSLKCSYLRRLPSRLTRVITAHVAFVSNAFFGSCFFFPRTKKHFTPVFANFSLSNKEHFGLDYEIDNFG